MTKKYSAKSVIALSVTFKNGTTKHISFNARTTGGSVYYSSDAKEQEALEAHPKFGKLFKLEKAVAPEKPAPVKKESAKEKAEGKKDGLTEIKVTDLAAAKDYLSDRFGVSRTKLRSTKNIVDAATANGIKFIGI